MYTGSDNVGNFQRAAYEELKRHRDQRKPFRCYVNPASPSEAVLYRQLRGEMLVFYTGFAAFFGLFGVGTLRLRLPCGIGRQSSRQATHRPISRG